ncbi:MAG: chemotaxis protein CheW [Veillonellaceae bacterium]|nr:chemotaxis protein CheW [Veillonellaceae bacterium]
MSEKTYSDGEVQLVVFKLGREEYGISILEVQEIKRMTEITRVPHTPPYIKGVINLRGSVLPVLDLRKRLNLPSIDDSDDTRIIIVKIEDLTVGMIVDSVSEVTALNQENIEPPSAVVGGVAANYLSGVGKQDDRLLILLNLDEIIGISQDSKVG